MKKVIALLLFIVAFVLLGDTEARNNSPGNLEYYQGDILVAQLTPAPLVLEVAQLLTMEEVAYSIQAPQGEFTLVDQAIQRSTQTPLPIIRTLSDEWTTDNVPRHRYAQRGPPRTTPGSNTTGCYG